MVTSWAVSQIDLSDPGFWGRPFGERDAAFELLRRGRAGGFFPRPAAPPPSPRPRLLAAPPLWGCALAHPGTRPLSLPPRGGVAAPAGRAAVFLPAVDDRHG